MIFECPHGEEADLAAQGLCPPCLQTPAVAAEAMIVYGRREALFDGRCGLDCDCRIRAGDRIALVGPDHEDAVWAREACADEACD